MWRQGCDDFTKLAHEGFYNGTTFHRVIPGFMIQAAIPTARILTVRRTAWEARAQGQGRVQQQATQARGALHGALERPRQRRLTVLHLRRGREFSRLAVHGIR